jgi:hypothetical protein
MTRPLVIAQVIGTCGHCRTEVVSLADWPASTHAHTNLWADVGPILRDSVPCAACRDGKTPEWDRSAEGRRDERRRRAAEARRIATALGLSQSTIDRAASYSSDVERFDSPESAVAAAIAAAETSIKVA